MKEDKKNVRLAPTDSEGLPIYPFSEAALNPQAAPAAAPVSKTAKQPATPNTTPAASTEPVAPASPVTPIMPTSPVMSAEPVTPVTTAASVADAMPNTATPEPVAPVAPAAPIDQPTTNPTDQQTAAPAEASKDKKLEVPKSPFDFDKRLPKTQEKAKKPTDTKLLLLIGGIAIGAILLIFAIVMIVINSSSSSTPAPSTETSQVERGGGTTDDGDDEEEDDEEETDEEEEGGSEETEEQADEPQANASDKSQVPTDASNASAEVKSRDETRAESLSKLNSAIMNYRSNNRNKLPSEGKVVSGATDPNIVVMDNSGYPDFAANADSWGYFYASYLLVGGMETFADPDGNAYSLIVSECGSVTVGDACSVGQRSNVSFAEQTSGLATDFGPVGHAISIVTHSNCDNGRAVYSTSAKKVSLLYRKEAGGVLCVSD